MARNSVIALVGDGVQTQFSVAFTGGYLDESHITCRVGDEVDGSDEPVYREITFISPGLLEVGGDVPGDGVSVEFRRTTPIADLLHAYLGGVPFSSQNVDESLTQLLFGVQEAHDLLSDAELAQTLADQIIEQSAEAQEILDAIQASVEWRGSYDGDTVTNPITLGITPTSASTIMVILDGLVQDDSLYTIDGAELTFTGGWPTNVTSIEVYARGASDAYMQRLHDASTTGAVTVQSLRTHTSLWSNIPLQLGTSAYFWVDENNQLRIKNSAPTSDYDVASQEVCSSQREASAVDIASQSADVNTVGKHPGLQIWDTTNNRMMRAGGSAVTSTWYVIDGSASVTPT